MISTRSALYLGGGALLVAWFAAAAGSSLQEAAPPRERSSGSALATTGRSPAADVQVQAARLRERLSEAPVPAARPRNPFSFASSAKTAAPRARSNLAPAAAPETPTVPPLPLVLVGVAEEPSFEGIHRTAVIAGQADALYIVMEGQAFADRYRVTAIGADAVELKDLITGAYRRIALR